MNFLPWTYPYEIAFPCKLSASSLLIYKVGTSELTFHEYGYCKVVLEASFKIIKLQKIMLQIKF